MREQLYQIGNYSQSCSRGCPTSSVVYILGPQQLQAARGLALQAIHLSSCRRHACLDMVKSNYSFRWAIFDLELLTTNMAMPILGFFFFILFTFCLFGFLLAALSLYTYGHTHRGTQGFFYIFLIRCLANSHCGQLLQPLLRSLTRNGFVFCCAGLLDIRHRLRAPCQRELYQSGIYREITRGTPLYRQCLQQIETYMYIVEALANGQTPV